MHLIVRLETARLVRYQTLGIDYQCSNITNQIRCNEQDRNCYLPANSRLPHPLTLTSTNYTTVIDSTSTPLYPDRGWFPGLDELGPLISNTYIIVNLNGLFAIECVLYWSVFEYQSKTANGFFNETSNGNWTTTYPVNQTSYNQADNIWMTPSSCWVNGSQYDSNDYYSEELRDPVDNISECVYVITRTVQRGLQFLFINSTGGLYGYAGVNEPCTDCCFENRFAIYLRSLLAYTMQDPVPAIENYMFRNLVHSMTGTIRQLPRGSFTGGDSYTTYPRCYARR